MPEFVTWVPGYLLWFSQGYVKFKMPVEVTSERGIWRVTSVTSKDFMNKETWIDSMKSLITDNMTSSNGSWRNLLRLVYTYTYWCHVVIYQDQIGVDSRVLKQYTAAIENRQTLRTGICFQKKYPKVIPSFPGSTSSWQGIENCPIRTSSKIIMSPSFCRHFNSLDPHPDPNKQGKSENLPGS